MAGRPMADRIPTQGLTPSPTPFHGVFSKELTMAAERSTGTVLNPTLPSKEPAEVCVEDYAALQHRRSQLELVADQVAENLKNAQSREQRDYAKRHGNPMLRPVNKEEADPLVTLIAQTDRATGGPVSLEPQPAAAQKRKSPIKVDNASSLEHAPDLAENTKVYRWTRHSHKLGTDREGPFFFKYWNALSTLALVETADGQPFTVPVKQLFVPSEIRSIKEIKQP
ncbi:hypothetical protein VOLCADRAFT_90906 [Volvox carteri f. nagariensis]|uniref:Uncharacterized protein n=1 Tax=Volvox carteri f. nagariensis TaxID=3068 RepID=D8TVD8_VOLCA|nr:uncharacterized protein VOLCADRAFT_90906 [Volvox carteri f. nagariensis]EFJ48560.1 hypothetical protein VOLCADRAFT_90906 [Volvox carteri f. nagariensis]|eukprot:XP_002950359.1 hypothetical protein VOLCADRAFT_90906 [Volvox carteri f. nagariensis]